MAPIAMIVERPWIRGEHLEAGRIVAMALVLNALATFSISNGSLRGETNALW